MIVQTNCKWCGCNTVNFLTNFCDQFIQIVCSNCGVSGPKITRDHSLRHDAAVEHMSKRAMEGWNKVNGNG